MFHGIKWLPPERLKLSRGRCVHPALIQHAKEIIINSKKLANSVEVSRNRFREQWRGTIRPILSLHTEQWWVSKAGWHAATLLFTLRPYSARVTMLYTPQMFEDIKSTSVHQILNKYHCHYPVYRTRKPSCRWQTRATLAKSLHGLRKSSGVVTCIARLPIASLGSLKVIESDTIR